MQNHPLCNAQAARERMRHNPSSIMDLESPKHSTTKQHRSCGCAYNGLVMTYEDMHDISMKPLLDNPCKPHDLHLIVAGKASLHIASGSSLGSPCLINTQLLTWTAFTEHIRSHQTLDSSADMYVMPEPRPCAPNPMPAMCCTMLSIQGRQMRWHKRPSEECSA
jgi:hypothetical protein